MVRLISRKRIQEIKMHYREGAWMAFLLGAAGGETTFGEYLSQMGLKEGQEGTDKQETKVSAQDAISKAEGILELARSKE